MRTDSALVLEVRVRVGFEEPLDDKEDDYLIISFASLVDEKGVITIVMLVSWAILC